MTGLAVASYDRTNTPAHSRILEGVDNLPPLPPFLWWITRASGPCRAGAPPAPGCFQRVQAGGDAVPIAPASRTGRPPPRRLRGVLRGVRPGRRRGKPGRG